LKAVQSETKQQKAEVNGRHLVDLGEGRGTRVETELPAYHCSIEEDC